MSEPQPAGNGAGPDGGEAGPRREPFFNIPPVVLWLIGICVVVQLVRVYGLNLDQEIELLVRAAVIPARYSGRFGLDIYAFTSPFTYTFLHGGLVHIAVNMVWLAAFGPPLANRLGTWRFLLFWAVTGLAAAALHCVLDISSQAPLVGASGAISGMMGAAARFGFAIDRSAGRPAFGGPIWPIGAVLRSRTAISFVGVWMVINLVSGLLGVPGVEGQIAWQAHLGGFFAGFFGISLFDPLARSYRRR